MGLMTLGTALAVVVAGIAGCFATGLMLKALTGRSPMVVAGNWRKHLWSIIFAIPLPFLLTLPGSRWLNLALAFVWLMLAPSVASKFHFGPKDAPWQRLFMLHGAYGFVAILAFMVVVHLV